MEHPLNSYCITKTIYHLSNAISVSVLFSECSGHQTAFKKLTGADGALFLKGWHICASSFLLFNCLVTSQVPNFLLLNCQPLSFMSL